MPIGAFNQSKAPANVEKPLTFNNMVITDGITPTTTFGSQTTNFRGLFFRSGGTRLFIVDSNSAGGRVHQYSLSTAWDLNTITYDNISYLPSPAIGFCDGLFFSPDGTRMFILDRTNVLVRSYNLSTPWQISSGVTAGSTFSVSGADPAPRGMYFNSLGTRLFVGGSTSNRVGYYTLSTPWDISTAGTITSAASDSNSPNYENLFVTEDGLRMVTFDSSAFRVLPSNTGTVYNFTSGTWASQPAVFYQDLALNLRDIFVSEDFKYYIVTTSTQLYKIQNPSYSVSNPRIRSTVASASVTLGTTSANDYMILFDSSTVTTQVVPSGWTLLDTVSVAGIRTTISYKKLVAGDSGTTVTGQGNNTAKYLLHLRPSQDSNISFSTVNSEANAAAPTQQTISMSGETGPIFGIAFTASTGTSTRTFGGKLPYANLSNSSTGINTNLRVISYQGDDVPSNNTISMTDGGVNTMQSFWVKFTPV